MLASSSPDTFCSPRISSIPPDLTTVTLANDETRSVHRNLLTASSENFAAALTGRFYEASKNSLDLSDTDAQTFSYYTDWLYSGRLLEEVTGRTAHDYGTLFGLYFFGDRYRVPQLKRAVMTRIIQVSDAEKTVPVERTIFAAFDSLPASDPLLAWIVDEYVAQWQPSNGAMIDRPSVAAAAEGDEDAAAAEVNQEFLICLVNRMAEATWTTTRLEWRAGKGPCDYHAHETEASRQKCVASSKIRMPPQLPPLLAVNAKAEKDAIAWSTFTPKRSWWRSLSRRSSRKA